MKNKFYMNEFQYHDGECYVTFNIVDLNELKGEIQVAITRQGRKIVRIDKNRMYTPEFGTYEKGTKSATSERDIPLTDDLISELRAYMEWFRLADADFDNKLDDYYFAVNIYREPEGTGSIGQWLKSFEKKNGFKKVTCHGLRHTYCSIMLAKNVPVNTVSKYMGHADPTITLKVYAHFIPDTVDTALMILSELTADG